MSLTCVVVVSAGGWLWFMEFGLTCGCSTRCAWSCEVGITGDSGGQVKLIPTLIEVCDGWSIGGFDFGWWGVWLVVMMNDEWWFVVLRSMIGVSVVVYLLLVTCYSCSLSLCDSVNCRVVWGLDHKAGAGRVVGYWLLMVLVGDWRESCFSGDQVGLLMNCY